MVKEKYQFYSLTLYIANLQYSEMYAFSNVNVK